MEERWRDIVGYEGLYQVSNLGNIKSLGNSKNKTEKILKPVISKYGYCRVGLYKNNKVKRCAVHRLVAETFIPNPENKRTVNHIDGNKINNNADNLEWCTDKENINKAWETGLYKNKVLKTTNKITLINYIKEKMNHCNDIEYNAYNDILKQIEL